MFKIRNKLTGEFSSGGMHPKWSNHGKSWSSLALATSSLSHYRGEYHNQLIPSRPPIDYLEVVEFEITEKSTRSAVELMAGVIERKKTRKALVEERCKEARRRADEKAFEELRVKLGK